MGPNVQFRTSVADKAAAVDCTRSEPALICTPSPQSRIKDRVASHLLLFSPSTIHNKQK